MNIMNKTEPMVLLMGLPTIPIMLVLSKMVRWEDRAIRFLRGAVRKMPLLKYILPGFRCVTLELAKLTSFFVPALLLSGFCVPHFPFNFILAVLMRMCCGQHFYMNSSFK